MALFRRGASARCLGRYDTKHSQTLGATRIPRVGMGVCLRIDCRRTGVFPSAFHRVVSSLDGCVGRLVRMVVAPATMVSWPGVVAKTHIVESDGQYYSVLANRLGRAVSALG